jgi:riboflavin transporter 2
MASIPFITSKFSKQYIVPYYIGETLIGVIPSALALLQGTGEDKGCHNVTSTVTLSINGSFESVNETRPESIPLTPRFSVSTYFLIIFVFLFGSFVSFTLLNFVSFSNIDKEEETKEEEERSVNVDLLVTNPESVATDAANNDKKQERKNLLEKRYLLFLNFMVTFIVYGILPALNSYSTLPYGNHVFHASINMGTIFMPIFIIASLMVSHPSVIQITIEFMIAVSFSVYILVLSFQSPCPILLNSVFGPILSVLSWYLSSGFFTRVRCLISTRLAQYGEKTLLYSGAMTLVGEIVGGSIMFVLVEHLRLFTEKEPCVPSDCPNSF